jgi:hypothetical protein
MGANRLDKLFQTLPANRVATDMSYGDVYFENQIAKFAGRVLESYLRRLPTREDANLCKIEPTELKTRFAGKDVRSVETFHYAEVLLGVIVTSIVGNEGRLEFIPTGGEPIFLSDAANNN